MKHGEDSESEEDPVQPIGHLDLNLLATFDAVMVERNLRRAAERLGRSQPAVSQAVARLRDLIGDQLFDKVPTGVAPTPRAESLWQEIREPLLTIARAVDHRDFDPMTARGEFVLGLADDVHELCFPEIAASIMSAAPSLQLQVVQTDHIVVWDQISTGLVDLAVSVAPPSPRSASSQILGEQRFVLLHRSDQECPITLDQYLGRSHVTVGFADKTPGYIDTRLSAMGHARRIAAVTPRFASIPDLVRRTGAIATMPEPIAWAYAKDRALAVTALPFRVDPVPVRMGWHQRRLADPLNVWARAHVAGVVSRLLSTVQR